MVTLGATDMTCDEYVDVGVTRVDDRIFSDVHNTRSSDYTRAKRLVLDDGREIKVECQFKRTPDMQIVQLAVVIKVPEKPPPDPNAWTDRVIVQT